MENNDHYNIPLEDLYEELNESCDYVWLVPSEYSIANDVALLKPALRKFLAEYLGEEP